jgi:hypothetical protein
MEDAPQKYYEENPYQVNTPRGGEEEMSVVRAALMLSLGIIISVGIVVLFLHHKDRFTIVPQNRGIFVFDYKNSSVSFCSDKGCTLISINADSYNRETYFMPQGYMASSPQYSMGFMSPQAMQPNPYMNPQYSPYMPSPYPPQSNFGPQPGWVSFQNQQAVPMVPPQPMQPQQAFQAQANMQNNFIPQQQPQGQQQMDQGQQQPDQGQQQMDQGQQQSDQGQQQMDQGQQQPDQGQQQMDQGQQQQ